MTYYKTIARDINVNGKKRNDLLLNAEIFSYDEQVSKFVLTLQNDIDDINLNGAKVLAVMEYLVNGEKGSVEALSGVESTSDRSIYFIVPSKLRGFEGSVTAGVYINLTSGEKIDIQNLKFKMSKSLIDSTSGPAAEIYFESFDEVLIKVKNAGDIAINAVNTEAKKVSDHADHKIKEYDAKFTQSDQKMTELQQSQTELSNQLTETNKKIDEADVYRKSETMSSEEISANVINLVSGSETVVITLFADYKGKISGSTIENGNIMKGIHSALKPDPSEFTHEYAQSHYDAVAKIGDAPLSTGSTIENGKQHFRLCEFDLIDIFTRYFKEAFWINQGITTTAQKVAFIKAATTKFNVNFWGYGSSPTGNRLTTNLRSAAAGIWYLSSSHTENTVNKLTLSMFGQYLGNYIDNSSYVRMLAFAEVSDGVTASTVNMDYANIELTIELSANEYIQSMIAAYHRPFEAQLNDLAGRILALENK